MTVDVSEVRASKFRRRMLVFVFLLFALCTFFLFGIIYVREIASDIKKHETPPEQVEQPRYGFLPTDATDVVSVGNGWYEFTYKNQRFLFHRETTFHGSAYESVVRIGSSCSCQAELEEF